MAAITNWALVMHQQHHIHTRDDLDNFNKGVEVLQYTPYVDLALSVICTIGAMIALNTTFLCPALLFLSVVFFISGSAILKTRNSLDDMARATNQLWNAQVKLLQLKADLPALVDMRAKMLLS
jgi:hypothetical protein